MIMNYNINVKNLFVGANKNGLVVVDIEQKEENGIYTLTVDLEEGDEFIFTSMVTVGETSGVGTEYIRYSNIAADDLESQSFVTGTDSANLVASQAGTYTFTYDASTKVLTVNCQ